MARVTTENSSPQNDPTPRELESRDMMRRYRESGLTVAAFCKRERLSVSLFYYWKREIARRDLGLPKGSGNGKPRPHRESPFVPLNVCRVELDQAPLELVLGDSRRVRIGGDFDADVLKKLLAVLEPAR